MFKLAGLVCASLFLLFVASPQNNKFSKYKVVEAYEIRPGILMMPKYAEDGQVCEIGLERRRYSPETIRLDADIPETDVTEIVDELAPDAEKGPRNKGTLPFDLIETDGGAMTTIRDYENVSVQIFSHVLNNERRGTKVEPNVAVAIKWKNRTCE
jgi:hypothetical protein